MKAASIKNLKNELENQSPDRLLSLCLKLVKYKKENKELLSYLLFEENDESNYIESVKVEMDIAFAEVNIKNVYIAKKNLRKILRSVNRYIKYSSIKTTEAFLLIHFCHRMKSSGLRIDKSTALVNIYSSQVKKIKGAIATLHEDLQYDFRKEVEAL